MHSDFCEFMHNRPLARSKFSLKETKIIKTRGWGEGLAQMEVQPFSSLLIKLPQIKTGYSKSKIQCLVYKVVRQRRSSVPWFSRSPCLERTLVEPLPLVLEGASRSPSPGSVLFGSLPPEEAASSFSTAAVRAGPGERRLLWRGQPGPCPGRWACGGRPASAGRFSGRPGGTGSRCRSWRPWTGSQRGPWGGRGETLHWLQPSRDPQETGYRCLSASFTRGGGAAHRF